MSGFDNQFVSEMELHILEQLRCLKFDISLELICSNSYGQKLIEQSREGHYHKPHAIPDTKRNRKRAEIEMCTISKQIHEKRIDELPFPQARS